MKPKSAKSTGKFLALILRHEPEVIGITLDEHGWARVDKLVVGIARTQPFTLQMLEELVAADDKQRYAFNADHTMIRANQGHSLPVDVEPEELAPPGVLYHGTGEKYLASIYAQGLIPKARLYVHLSADYGTAVKVGSRHGAPFVFAVDAERMAHDGYRFYRAVNGVWLTDRVPVDYLMPCQNSRRGG